jgi:thioredoxin 1
MVAPIVHNIAEERDDVLVGKINVDEEQAIAAAFGVVSIPTLVVMKNGKIVRQATGARPKHQILTMLGG